MSWVRRTPGMMPPPMVGRPGPGCGAGAGGWGPGGGGGPPVSRARNRLKVAADRLKRVETLVRNGAKRAVSEPAAPSQRSWDAANVKPGGRALVNVLVMDCVVQPG